MNIFLDTLHSAKIELHLQWEVTQIFFNLYDTNKNLQNKWHLSFEQIPGIIYKILSPSRIFPPTCKEVLTTTI